MKYMLIMRKDDQAAAAFKSIPLEQVIESIGKYNESMTQAGVLVAGEGLSDASEGFVVDFSSETPLVTDGPYGETKELFNGFWIVDVASKEEAAEWASRAPLSGGSKIEVRRVTGPEDLPADNEWAQKDHGFRRAAEG